MAAFYCSADNTLYMPFAGLQTEMYGAHPGVYLAVLAHEYGHHVQAMSGVLDTYGEASYNAGVDTEAGLELSRRLELQAQCFSGMFLAATYGRGSVDDNILTEARTTQDRGDHNAGLPRDHGTDEHAIGVVGAGRAAEPHLPVQHLAVAAGRRGLTLRPSRSARGSRLARGPAPDAGTRSPRPPCR